MPPMSTPDDADPESSFAPRVALRADGTLESAAGADGEAQTSGPSAGPEPTFEVLSSAAIPTPAVPTDAAAAGDAPKASPPAPSDSPELELVSHVRRTDRSPEPLAWEPPESSGSARGRTLRSVGIGVCLLLLGVGIAWGAWGFFAGEAPMERLRSVRAAVTQAAGFHEGYVLVLTTPDGATLAIDGEVVGTTPFAGDLRWRPGAEVTLSKARYAPWTGTLPQGPDSKLEVTLEREGR